MQRTQEWACPECFRTVRYTCYHDGVEVESELFDADDWRVKRVRYLRNAIADAEDLVEDARNELSGLL